MLSLHFTMKDKRERLKLGGAVRSPRWREVRLQHLKINGSCAVCGKTAKLQVHHILPYHVKPELELEPTNLITLCENGNKAIDCHLFFGHLGNFRTKHNESIVDDAKLWNTRLLAKKIDDII